MKNEKKQDMTAELAEGKILPLVFKLTIPAVIAQLITFLYNIVDRMYVARIEGSGMDALAALGIVLPITLIMQAFANLVGLGGAPRAGIKLGEGNPDEANRIFHTAFCLLVLLGIVIGAAAFCFARQIVLLFGCPESAVEDAVSKMKRSSYKISPQSSINRQYAAMGYADGQEFDMRRRLEPSA